MTSVLEVLRRLKPRKYRYKERIHYYNCGCSISNEFNKHLLEIEHSQLKLFGKINSTVLLFNIRIGG